MSDGHQNNNGGTSVDQAVPESRGAVNSGTGKSAAAEQKPVRLSVNMNTETADALREIAEAHGVSITEAVRRAVSIAHFVEQQARSGMSVQIENPKTGKVKELLMM